MALQNAFLRRPLDPSELPGAEPLAARQPALAGLLAATSSSGSSSSCGSSAAPPAVQALHWEPPVSDSSYPPPPADPASGLLTHYWLDAASLVPPLLLDVQPGQHVLDMCSAPGGKAFVLAQLLLAQEQAAAAAAAAVEGGSSEDENQTSSGDCGSQLVCNEIDAARRARLVRVIRDYVPVPVRYSIRCVPLPCAAAAAPCVLPHMHGQPPLQARPKRTLSLRFAALQGDAA